MTWHETQDAQVSASFARADAALNNPSPTRRAWGFRGDESILQRHFLNIVSEFKPTDPFSLIDVGCGAGGLLRRVSDYFPNAELTGADTNLPSLEKARIRVPTATFLDAPFARLSGSFDIVVCCEVFEHVEDYSGLLDMLFRLVKPGGLISFSTPSGWMYRTPRLGNFYHAARDWDFFKSVRLKPESNWLRALPYHPGILPSKAIRMFKERGGTIVSRTSVNWFMTERSLAYWLCTKLDKRGGGTKIDAWMRFLDALMELVPPLRIFETRFVLAVRAPNRRC